MDKACVVCGRRIEWRKKWERDWASVRHCSDRCRRMRLTDVDRALEDSIRGLLSTRARSASTTPSEAAQAVSNEGQPLVERARMAARRLVAAGEIEIVQSGKVVDPSTAKGPIRLRRTGA